MIDELLNQLEGAFAPNTLRSYRADFEHFQDWCHVHAVDPFNADADDIATYINEGVGVHSDPFLPKKSRVTTHD